MASGASPEQIQESAKRLLRERRDALSWEITEMGWE
jgi:hypothetical protein